MRVLLNSINGAFNARARIKKVKHPDTRNSSARVGFSWCNINVPEAAIFKGVRNALKDERKDFRKVGPKRGKGASSATSAINVIQLKRIREAFADWGRRLKRDGARAELLRGIAPKKTGVNAYGRYLETEIALAAIDMGTYGGGRAVSDYTLYRVRDIVFVSDGYWVFPGDWRKTDRINSNGKFVGRGPFFVPDVDDARANEVDHLGARRHRRIRQEGRPARRPTLPAPEQGRGRGRRVHLVARGRRIRHVRSDRRGSGLVRGERGLVGLAPNARIPAIHA